LRFLFVWRRAVSAEAAWVGLVLWRERCAVSAPGLSFLRRDAILLPVIAVALVVAQWGFWRGRQSHRSFGPFALGLVGSFALVAGVVPLRGPIAKLFIGVGALALLGSAIWNARLPRSCDVPEPAATR
jgi:hypothetical protein